MATVHSRGELDIHNLLSSKDFVFNKIHEVVIKPGHKIQCHEFRRGIQSIVVVINLNHLHEDIKILLKPTWVQIIFYAPTFINAYDMLLKHNIQLEGEIS